MVGWSGCGRAVLCGEMEKVPSGLPHQSSISFFSLVSRLVLMRPLQWTMPLRVSGLGDAWGRGRGRGR